MSLNSINMPSKPSDFSVMMIKNKHRSSRRLRKVVYADIDKILDLNEKFVFKDLQNFLQLLKLLKNRNSRRRRNSNSIQAVLQIRILIQTTMNSRWPRRCLTNWLLTMTTMGRRGSSKNFRSRQRPRAKINFLFREPVFNHRLRFSPVVRIW